MPSCKFVLTSFDRATPSERQKFTFGSFNFWLWKWISQKVSFTFKNDKLALHFDRLKQNLVPIVFPISISIITIMLNLDKRKCVKGGKMRVKSVSIFQTRPNSHDVKTILNFFYRIFNLNFRGGSPLTGILKWIGENCWERIKR